MILHFFDFNHNREAVHERQCVMLQTYIIQVRERRPHF